MRAIILGDSKMNDYNLLFDSLEEDEYRFDSIGTLYGLGCNSLVRKFAKEVDIPIEVYDNFSKMFEDGERLIAFWNGRKNFTLEMIQEAVKLNIPVTIVPRAIQVK